MTGDVHETTYNERQRFRQWWLWALVLIGPGFVLSLLLRVIFSGEMIEGFSTNNTIIILLVFIIGLLFPIFLYFMELDTEVSESELRIRFRPFHRKWVIFALDCLEKAEPLTYNPLKDFGGWGIRYGKEGKAYNVHGNQGVLLTFSEGTTLLIGSQNHVLLAAKINSRLK